MASDTNLVEKEKEIISRRRFLIAYGIPFFSLPALNSLPNKNSSEETLENKFDGFEGSESPEKLVLSSGSNQAKKRVYITKENSGEHFDILKGVILTKYESPITREQAQKYADTVELMQSARRDYYIAALRRDNPPKGKWDYRDRTYIDISADKKAYDAFELKSTEIPWQIRSKFSQTLR